MTETKPKKHAGGRNTLPPEEKLKQIAVYVKPRYEKQIKELARNLNRYGTTEPPK